MATSVARGPLPLGAEGEVARLPGAGLARAVGEASLAFRRDPTGRTRLVRRHARSPLRVLTPREDRTEALAVLLNTCGGICGGDRLAVRVEVEAEAAATLTTQAAERVYRTISGPGVLRHEIALGHGAALHWAPHETILFDDAALDRRLDLHADATSRFVAAETLVLGRRAMGETVRTLDLSDHWRVFRDGRLVHAEATRLPRAAGPALAGPAGFGGHDALATVVAQGAGLEQARDDLNARLAADARALHAAAGLVSGLLVVRLLGAAAAVRGALTWVLEELRRAVLGFGAGLPRSWFC